MRTDLRVVAAVLVSLGLATGCERTIAGNVAMTTEPGTSTFTQPSATTSPSTSSPTESPSTSSPTSEVPAPPNALTMTCRDYLALDDATKLAVIRAIIADQHSMFPKGNEDIAKTMADATCQFLPDSTVSQLLGSPP